MKVFPAACTLKTYLWKRWQSLRHTLDGDTPQQRPEGRGFPGRRHGCFWGSRLQVCAGNIWTPCGPVSKDHIFTHDYLSVCQYLHAGLNSLCFSSDVPSQQSLHEHYTSFYEQTRGPDLHHTKMWAVPGRRTCDRGRCCSRSACGKQRLHGPGDGGHPTRKGLIWQLRFAMETLKQVIACEEWQNQLF